MTAKELRVKARLVAQTEKRIKLLTQIKTCMEKLTQFQGTHDIDDILQSMPDNFSDSFYHALLEHIDSLKPWD